MKKADEARERERAKVAGAARAAQEKAQKAEAKEEAAAKAKAEKEAKTKKKAEQAEKQAEFVYVPPTEDEIQAVQMENPELTREAAIQRHKDLQVDRPTRAETNINRNIGRNRGMCIGITKQSSKKSPPCSFLPPLSQLA